MERGKIFLLAALIAVGAAARLMAVDMDFKTAVSRPLEVSEESVEESTDTADASEAKETSDVKEAPEEASPVWANNDAKRQAMTTKREKEAARFPGRMGIFIKDLKTGRSWEYHGTELFPSASLIKVPVMASLSAKIKSGEISWNEKLQITRDLKRGGSGRLRRVRNGSKLTLDELVYHMITESDNTAANMLITRMGYPYLQDYFKKLGLERTNISHEGMSLNNYGVKNENYTTPREMAMLVENIYRGQCVDKDLSGRMISYMRKTKGHSRFAKRLPKGFQLAHKTGMLRLSCSDTGIIYSPQGDYILSVMTWKVPDYKFAANYISKVAGVTYKYYSGANPMVVRFKPNEAANSGG
jgi:beta-lactamase class A